MQVGLHVSREKLTFDGESLGHMAAALVDDNIVLSTQAAFDEYLADNNPCFVAMERINNEIIIKTIQSTGYVGSGESRDSVGFDR